MSTFPRVTVLGAGVLGSQIGFQAALHGKEVTLWDISDEALDVARGRAEAIVPDYVREVPSGDEQAARAAVAGLRWTSDLADAVAGADLVIEAVPERLDVKRDVWSRVGAVADEATVFATNSSTLLPSAIADATGRPDRFLALHFANHVWVNNTGEVMGHDATDPEVRRQVLAFAEEIGMVPIDVLKEQPGYVLNALLVPLLGAASGLLVRGVATAETIDLTWRTATGAPAGPFQIFDTVGLRTAAAVSAAGDEESRAFAEMLQRDFIAHGKVGRESGEGFYRYDEHGRQL